MEKFKKFLNEFYKIFSRKEITILPANLAYFFFISLIPIATIIIYTVTTFSLSFDTVTDFIKETFGSNFLEVIIPLMRNNNFDGSSVFVLFITLFIASNGAQSIIVASNTVFNIKNKNYFYRVFKAFTITLVLIITFVFLLLVPLFGQKILELFRNIGIDNQLTYAFNMLYPILKYPVTFLIVFILVKFIYKVAPDERIKSSYVNKGAIFTTVGWVIITGLYSIYINNVALRTYNIFYGSFAIIVILLLWFYLLALIFVVGIVLNYRDIEQYIDETNRIALDEIKEKVSEERTKRLSKKKKI